MEKNYRKLPNNPQRQAYQSNQNNQNNRNNRNKQTPSKEVSVRILNQIIISGIIIAAVMIINIIKTSFTQELNAMLRKNIEKNYSLAEMKTSLVALLNKFDFTDFSDFKMDTIKTAFGDETENKNTLPEIKISEESIYTEQNNIENRVDLEALEILNENIYDSESQKTEQEKK